MFIRHLPFRFFILFTLCLWGSAFAWAQDDAELPKPDFLTVRLFEASAPQSAAPSEQLFRMKTAVLTDDEKWCANLQKAYPEAEIRLLQTQHFRAFKSPKPSIVIIGESDQPHQELHLFTALGFGEGDKIVTMTVAEVNYYLGPKKQSSVPNAVANQNFESTPGMTYFFTRQEMKLTAQQYSRLLRERNYDKSFEAKSHYLIVAISYDDAPQAGTSFEIDKANALQAKATKKAEPQWPAEIKQKSLGGKIQVKAFLSEDGKVASATIWKSSLPEGNQAVLNAARQWEFPVSELAGMKPPAIALLSFSLPVPQPALLSAYGPPKPEPKNTVKEVLANEAQAAQEKAQTQPAPVKSQTKTPPKKVRRK